MNFSLIEITETERTPFTRSWAIHVPEALVEEGIRYEVEDHARVYSSRGFRPGRVPHSVVRFRFGDAMRTRVIDQLVEVAVARATKGLCLMYDPMTEVTQITDGIDLTVIVSHRPDWAVMPHGRKAWLSTTSAFAYNGLDPVNKPLISAFCAQTLKEIAALEARRA